MLEVAYSETDQKLQSDIRFWLSPSNGGANICLTVKLDLLRSSIRIENWRRSQNRIRRKQIVLIRRNSDKLIVTGDLPLSILFEDLFLRKTERPREHDIEIFEGDLKNMQELCGMIMIFTR